MKFGWGALGGRVEAAKGYTVSFGLNIYPMMDMLTILLVYMMAIFATSSAAAVQESSELRIPYSTSKVEVSEALERAHHRGVIPAAAAKCGAARFFSQISVRTSEGASGAQASEAIR